MVQHNWVTMRSMCRKALWLELKSGAVKWIENFPGQKYELLLLSLSSNKEQKRNLEQGDFEVWKPKEEENKKKTNENGEKVIKMWQILLHFWKLFLSGWFNLPLKIKYWEMKKTLKSGNKHLTAGKGSTSVSEDACFISKSPSKENYLIRET